MQDLLDEDMQFLIKENLMTDLIDFELFGRVEWWTYVIGISCQPPLWSSSKEPPVFTSSQQ